MKNLTFKAAMLKGSQPTVNRQSTDGQSQRHCKQTPLSKRWEVLMTLVFLFTFAIGQMWATDPLDTRYVFPSAVSAGGSVDAYSGEDNTMTLQSSCSVTSVSSGSFAGTSYSYGLKIDNSNSTKGCTFTISASTENPAHVYILGYASGKTVKLRYGNSDVSTAYMYAAVGKPGIVELVTTKSGTHTLYADGAVYCYRVDVLYEKNTNIAKTVKSGAAITVGTTISGTTSELYFFKPMEAEISNNGYNFDGTSGGYRKSIVFTAHVNGKLTAKAINTTTNNRQLNLYAPTNNTSNGDALANVPNFKNGDGEKTLTYGNITKGTTYALDGGAGIRYTYISLEPYYAVTYDLNGGSGTTPTQSAVAAGVEITLHNGTTGITPPEGKVFDGWLCSIDDAVKAGSAKYTMTAAATTFTAQWADASSAVAVTGVELDITSKEFTLGGTVTATLTATVAPNDATNKAVSWESSAPTKVSVTDNGDGTADIEALAEGTATITVTTTDGSYTATCNVTVHPDPCFAWGYGTTNTTAPSNGNSVTIGSKLTIANVGSSTNNEAPFDGATTVGSIATNGSSKYLTGTLGGDIIESVTFSVYTSSADNKTYQIAFASSAEYNTANLITLPNGYTSYTYTDAPAKTGERKTVVVAAPAGAKSFAISRNLASVTFDSNISLQNSGNRNIYYIQACPHVCDGTAATKYNVTGTAAICASDNTDITLANSQTGAKYVLLKDNAEVDGSEKAGTTGSALVWSVSAAGTYTVKAIEYGDFCETAMNGSAVITAAAESPVITTQPTASQKVAVNAAISLSVATSTEGVSYQWFKMTDPAGPAVEIDGAKSATLNVNAASTATTMYYYCVISKSGMCSVESDLATVITKTGCETEELATSTITGATTDNHSGCSTTIKLQDANGKLNGGAYFEMSLNGGFKAGDIVTVNVKANDYESGKLYMVYGTHSSYSGYQVQNGPTEGNTADVEFIIPSDMPTIGFLRITNTGDEEKEQNHEIKSVTVERETCYCVKPTIGTQPASSAICSGLTATLSVGNIDGGVAPYTYAWYNGDGTAVSGGSGANTASYTTAALAANASYYCVVSTADGCSVQSSTAAITIKPATTITTQPVDANASVGIAQTFSIEANGAGTLEYQWQIKNGENWDDIANAEEATYSVSKDAAGAYQFRCIVSGDCGDDVVSNVVTLTVSADIFTVTYNANGGTCATPSATWSEGDEALVLPTATKSNYVITGWYDSENHLVGRAGGKYTPTASIELFAHYVPNIYEASYSNHFDGFINVAAQTITVYYLEGESAPTLSSIKVLGVETPTFVDNGDNIVITVNEVAYTFEVTKTEVEAYSGLGSTFAGEESYVKTGNSFSTSDSKKGWIYARNHKDSDGEDYSREATGKNRIYFFLGAAQSIKLTSGVSGNARSIKVYRNGVEVFSGNMPKSGDDTNYITFNGANSAAMYALVSNQSSGDGSVKAIEITPWVPVESIVLKEGTTAISSKEIAQGAQFTLTAEVTPANASNPAIVWESENASIASVANGVVTGEATGGPVNIIARSQDDNSIYAACAVTVAAPCTPATVAWDVEPVDGIKGHNGSASVTTNYAAGLEVVSSDPTVASVSNDGVNITINYLKKGTTKITATVVGDGSIYCNTPVSVEKTITVEPDCPAVGNLFSLEFLSPTGDDKTYAVSKNNDPVQIQTAAATIVNGEAYFHTTASSATITVENGECAFRSGNSGNYMKIEFECPLQVGDIISFTTSHTNRELDFYNGNNKVTTSGLRITVNSNEHALYGATVLTIKGGNSECSVKTLSIDRPAQITLNGNGGKIGDETSVVVPAVGATQLPNARKDGDYYFIGWSLDPADDENLVDDPYTPSATTVTLYAQYATCVASGTVYKFEVKTLASGQYIFPQAGPFPASAAMTTDNYLSTLVGGDLTASVTSSSGNYQNIYIDNSGVDGVTAFMTQSSYGVLTMDLGCPLKAGDVIRYNIVSDSGKKLTLKDDNSHSVNIFGNNANEVDEINVPADFVGATQLTLNYNGSACRIASFEVYRRPAVTGVSLADLTIAKATAGTPAMTLLPSDAYVASQAWSIVGEGGGTIANINETTGVVSALAEGDVTVKVVLNGDDNLSATCTVHVIADYELATVDGSATWDWNDVPGSQIESNNGVGVVLANKIAPTATFKSDELEIFMQYLRRTSNNKVFCQGQKIHMETTVPGILKVTFRNTGGNGKRTVQVNGIFSSDVYSENSGTDATYVCLVPAGPVNIEAVQLNADGEFQELSFIQIHKIEFDADPDHHREGLSSSNIGTLCWTNNAVIWGATLYEFAGKNENNYLVFDEVVDNRIEAGTPYIFMPKNGQTEIKVFNMDNADALTEADLQPVNNMYGTFEGKDLRPDQDADMYYFSGHNIWRVGDFTVEKITIPAYRCYVDYPAVLAGAPAAAPAPGRRRVTMGVNGKDVATGMENINASDKPMKVMIDGQLFIIRGEKMFDATGRLVK